MSYLKCNNCDWTQDDYWSKDYNPLRSLLYWESMLLSDRLDEVFKDEETRYEKTWRNVIMDALDEAKKNIGSMKYRTKEEVLQNNPTLSCPRCKSKLDED